MLDLIKAPNVLLYLNCWTIIVYCIQTCFKHCQAPDFRATDSMQLYLVSLVAQKSHTFFIIQVKNVLLNVENWKQNETITVNTDSKLIGNTIQLVQIHFCVSVMLTYSMASVLQFHSDFKAHLNSSYLSLLVVLPMWYWDRPIQ